MSKTDKKGKEPKKEKIATTTATATAEAAETPSKKKDSKKEKEVETSPEPVEKPVSAKKKVAKETAAAAASEEKDKASEKKEKTGDKKKKKAAEPKEEVEDNEEEEEPKSKPKAKKTTKKASKAKDDEAEEADEQQPAATSGAAAAAAEPEEGDKGAAEAEEKGGDKAEAEDEDDDDFFLDTKKKKKKKAVAKPEETGAATTSSDLPWEGTDRDYSYTELLERIFTLLREKNPNLAERKRHSMPPPQLVRVGTKKTMWANFAAIVELMHRQPEHLMSFLLAELGTEGSIDGNQRLLIKGRFNNKQIESLLRKYIIEYVTCHMCRNPDTTLTRDPMTRLYFLECASCGSRRSVAPIRSGFHATNRKDRQKVKEAAN